jgi:hypothetical protein
MTKVIFASAALIAAAVITTQAQARSSHAAARHTMNRTHTMTDCVRAPKVGAFATAPYSEPPCMPNTIN